MTTLEEPKLVTYTREEQKSLVYTLVDSEEGDNERQLIIYTGMYRWEDGTIRNAPELIT